MIGFNAQCFFFQFLAVYNMSDPNPTPPPKDVVTTRTPTPTEPDPTPLPPPAEETVEASEPQQIEASENAGMNQQRIVLRTEVDGGGLT